MPPRYPGQSLFLKAQATKGKDDPEYIEALSESEWTSELADISCHMHDLMRQLIPEFRRP
jgi:hypothetical protein